MSNADGRSVFEVWRGMEILARVPIEEATAGHQAADIAQQAEALGNEYENIYKGPVEVRYVTHRVVYRTA